MAPRKPKEAKPLDAVDMKSKDPRWYDLFCVLSDAADHLLQSLLNRDDIPDDAKDLLRGVLVLRESRHLFLATGSDVTPATALFLTEELEKWSKKNPTPN